MLQKQLDRILTIFKWSVTEHFERTEAADRSAQSVPSRYTNKSNSAQLFLQHVFSLQAIWLFILVLFLQFFLLIRWT